MWLVQKIKIVVNSRYMNEVFRYDNLNVVKRIGKGSFSNVYICNLKDKELPELFIVKEIKITQLLKKYIKHQFNKTNEYAKTNMNATPHSKRVTGDESVMHNRYYNKIKGMVESEVDVLKMLCHENVVNFFGYCLNYDIYYLSMEYCDGGDLRKILKKSNVFPRNRYGGIKDEIVKTITIQIASGLSYLESLNLIHRDMKLQNLLYKNGIYKIADFGFACYDLHNVPFEEVDMQDPLSSKYFKVCGTPFYMAPELLDSFQIQNPDTSQEYTRYCKKIDIWSFGLCIYELLFNKMPFNEIGSFEDLQDFFIEPRYAQDDIQSSIIKSELFPDFKSLLLMTLVIDVNSRVNINELSVFIKNNMIKNDEFKQYDSWEKIDLEFDK